MKVVFRWFCYFQNHLSCPDMHSLWAVLYKYWDSFYGGKIQQSTVLFFAGMSTGFQRKYVYEETDETNSKLQSSHKTELKMKTNLMLILSSYQLKNKYWKSELHWFQQFMYDVCVFLFEWSHEEEAVWFLMQIASIWFKWLTTVCKTWI